MAEDADPVVEAVKTTVREELGELKGQLLEAVRAELAGAVAAELAVLRGILDGGKHLLPASPGNTTFDRQRSCDSQSTTAAHPPHLPKDESLEQVLRGSLRQAASLASIDSRFSDAGSPHPGEAAGLGPSPRTSPLAADQPSQISRGSVESRSRGFRPLTSYHSVQMRGFLAEIQEAAKKSPALGSVRSARDLQVGAAARLLGDTLSRTTSTAARAARQGDSDGGSSEGKYMRTAALGADMLRIQTVKVNSFLKNSKKNSVDAAMALSEERDPAEEEDKQQTPLQAKAERILSSRRFETLSVFFIVASTVQLGWQTEYMAREMQTYAPLPFRVMDLCFFCFFIFESALRIFVHRGRFFCTWGWGWNAVDILLILAQALEEVLLAASRSPPSQRAGQMLVRTYRILRVVRTVRIFHIMRFADELRLLVSCLVHSSNAFFWAIVLIMLIIYVLGLVFTHVTVYERILWTATDGSRDTESLTFWFGSVPRSVLSLFQGLTGGVDWNDLAQPLIEHCTPWMGVVFFVYSAFSILAVMNVVTATFVQQAIERATQMKDLQKMTKAAKLFKTIDIDKSGIMTWEALEGHLGAPEVLEFFRSIDVDVGEARLVFEMLDYDNSGSLDFSEFLTGVFRMQGPAKAIDIAMVIRELKESMEALKRR